MEAKRLWQPEGLPGLWDKIFMTEILMVAEWLWKKEKLGLSVWETQGRDMRDKRWMQIGGGSRFSFLLFSLKMCALLTEVGGKEETVTGRGEKRKNSKKKKQQAFMFGGLKIKATKTSPSHTGWRESFFSTSERSELWIDRWFWMQRAQGIWGWEPAHGF